MRTSSLFSVRYKMLALVTVVLLSVMVTYLFLATTLFRRDKIAYVYDLNNALAYTLSEQTRVAVETLIDKVVYFADRPSAEAGRLLNSQSDVLQLQLWKRVSESEYAKVDAWSDPARLSKANVRQVDIDQAAKVSPIVWGFANESGVHLQNTSVAPDVALLTMAVRLGQGERMATVVLQPQNLLRIFAKTDAYDAYLVDRLGHVLVHPDAQKVVARADISNRGIVREALSNKPSRGAQMFDSAGTTVIGAFSRVDALGLTVLTETPESEALRASHELIERSILFAVGVVLLAFIASIFFSRRLTAPLRELEAATTDVASGNFAVKVQTKSRDEVGSLANAFNRMAHELSDRDRRLSETREQLIQSEKLAALGAMSAEISHEVKNPLTSVMGFAQLGQRNPGSEENKEYFATIENQARRARDILDSLLSYTRQETAKKEDIDLCLVVKETARLLQQAFRSYNVKLDLQLFSVSHAQVKGNANQLQQVLLNLMINAQHAMEEKGGTLTVRVERDGTQWRVSIKDTGVGMSDEVRQKLFRPFFTTKPKGKGTGLGLSVSQTIVNEHEGRIEVQSEPGVGTTFSVCLPAN